MGWRKKDQRSKITVEKVKFHCSGCGLQRVQNDQRSNVHGLERSHCPQDGVRENRKDQRSTDMKQFISFQQQAFRQKTSTTFSAARVAKASLFGYGRTRLGHARDQPKMKFERFVLTWKRWQKCQTRAGFELARESLPVGSSTTTLEHIVSHSSEKPHIAGSGSSG